jgi:putative aldouronate transport system substrate-binding protein
MQAELADEYMDLARFREILGADNGSLTQEAWDILTAYLKNLKDADKLQYGASPATMRWLPERAFYSLQGKGFVAHKEDETARVVNYFETEDAKLMFKTFNEWWNAGYINMDVLSAEDPRAMERKSDGFTLWMAGHQYADPDYTGPTRQWDSEYENSTSWDFPVRAVGWEKNIFIAPLAGSNALQGLIIPRTSKNPEKALDYIWHTNSNYDLHAILAHGIEGVHYTRTEDKNNVDPIIKEADQAKYRGEGWNIGNTFLADPYSLDGTEWIDYNREIVMGKAIATPLAGFQVDIEPIKNELEQFNAVQAEYEWALDCGAVEDWENHYNEMIEKMKSAGSDAIIAEMQAQVDAYLAEK